MTTAQEHPADTDLHVITRLYEVSLTCARVAADRETCLDALLRAALEFGGADRATLRLVDPATRQLDIAASQGWTPSALAVWADASDPLSEALVRALSDGKRIAVADVDRDDPRFDAAMNAACRIVGSAAVQWTPLASGRGELLGVIELHFSTPRVPGPRELRISDLLSRQAADYLERRKIESDVRTSEERFRAFTSATSDVVYRMNSDWTEMHQLHGREFVASTNAPSSNWIALYIPEEDQERVRQTIRAAVESASVFELEHRVIRVDGTIGWTHSRAIPITDEAGRVTEWFGTASDVTGRYEDQKALLASEARYRILFQSIDEGYCIIRMLFDDAGQAIDYVFEEVNRSFERQTGLREVEGRRMSSLAPAHETDWYEVYGQIALTGEPQRFERHAAALNRWYNVYAYRIGEPQERRVAVLFHDISERKRAEIASSTADRHKDEFLATLAHELRNPLAPIRTGLDILKMEPGLSLPVSSVVRMIERQVNQMVRLVDDLLEVSRISLGTIELHRQHVDLASVLHHAVETSRPLIDARGHRLAIALPDAPLIVDGDPVRLAQAISNLLNNAAKYTNSDTHGDTNGSGRLELSARRDGASAAIVVRDNGIGIAEDMLPRIFDWFVQVDRTNRRGQGGLGVGLTLVRTLVQLHGGTVTAHSDGLERGASFVVRLPLAETATPARPEAGRADEPARLHARMLVVDDNRDAAQSLAMLLQLRGAEVSVVHDGAAALAVLDEFRPDIVLLDLGMPNMSGHELARRIRARPDGRHFTLIAITGWVQEKDQLRSRESGIDHHLGKPVDFAVLERFLK